MERTAKILAVVGLLVLCGSALAADGNEPIAHWKFDETSGTTAYDSSGNGNDGILIGEPKWIGGIIDGALSFDGVNDYVSCGTGPAITGTGPFAVSAWVKTDASKGQAVLTQRSESSANGSYGLCVLADGRVQSHTYNGGYGVLFKSDVTVNDGLWHHIAVVRTNSTDGEIYVDGSLSGSDSGPARSLNNVPVWIGGPGFTVPVKFNGLIDDVRIYDRALSAEEVQQLYQEGLPELVGLEITGPEEVAEDFQAQYKAIAYYDNNSTKNVTDEAQWSVEPNEIASINSNGLLTTEEIYILEEDITIHAQYTEDTNTVETEKAVSVFAICPTGNALSFDGVDDYVDMGSAASLELGSFTISAWIKPDDVSSRQQIAGKLGNEPVHNRGYGYSLEVLDGKASLLIDPAGCCNGNPIKSETSLEVGKWYFVAGTYDGSTGTIYVDGQPENSDSWTLGAYYTNFYIGARRSDYHSAFYDHFSGVIDEVRVYDRALSPEEIQANMHILLSGDEPNLVGYWGFDEGEGQVAYDLSGNSNNGYLGSDPCDVDSADPAWVESDAPIGICTTGGLIERNITRALESKQRALEEIEAALANENATIGVLEALFRSRGYGNLDKNDIVKAKQEIHSAVQNEQRSTDTLEKSIEKLEDSLSILGYEVEANGSNN